MRHIHQIVIPEDETAWDGTVKGPVLSARAAVTAPVLAEGQTPVASPAVFAARGGGSVNQIEQWIVGDQVVGSGSSYTIQALDAGKTLAYQSLGYEIGGTHPGQVSSAIIVGTIPAAGDTLVFGGDQITFDGDDITFAAAA